jgi:hypothetical protein
MSTILNDPRLAACYHLFLRPEIQKSPRNLKDLVLIPFCPARAGFSRFAAGTRKSAALPVLTGLRRPGQRRDRLFQRLGDLGGLSGVAGALLDIVDCAAAGVVGSLRVRAVIQQKAHHLG